MVNKTLSMQNYIRWIVGLAFMGAAVYGNSYYFQEPLLYRVIGVIIISSIGLFILTTTQEGKEALKTVIDSRTEIRRVVWPTRAETTQTFAIVFGAIIVLCLFFWGLESLLSWIFKFILG